MDLETVQLKNSAQIASKFHKHIEVNMIFWSGKI